MNVGPYPPLFLLFAAGALSCTAQSREQSPHVQAALAPVTVEAQPLAANIQRLVEALEYLGAPLPAELRRDLTRAGQARDARGCRSCSIRVCCSRCTSIRRRA